jgi:hypothetical protein
MNIWSLMFQRPSEPKGPRFLSGPQFSGCRLVMSGTVGAWRAHEAHAISNHPGSHPSSPRISSPRAKPLGVAACHCPEKTQLAQRRILIKTLSAIPGCQQSGGLQEEANAASAIRVSRARLPINIPVP